MDNGWRTALSGLRVMLVEDDPDTRDVLTLGLQLSGAEVVAVGSSPEALAALPRFRPHVLLSDIGLGGDDGYSLIRRVRSLPAEDGGGVPAAAVTAFTLADDRRRALEAGFQAYFAKPVDTSKLINAVAHLASQARYLGAGSSERRNVDRRMLPQDTGHRRARPRRRREPFAP